MHLLLVAATSLGAGPEGRAAELAGPQLRAALLGSWCNSDDGGKTCWAYDEFLADGSFRACGRTPDDGQYFEGSGSFDVSGRRMCYRVHSATDTFWVRPGSRFCTDILAIDKHQHRYLDIESGRSFVLHRRAADRALCPLAK
jgi:hypothetical protein